MPSLKGRNILILEDDDDLRDSLREAIESEGATVFPLNSGRRVSEVLNSCKIDGAVIDMIIPDAFGIDIIPKVAKTGASIVAISGDPGVDPSAIYNRGAHVFIRKPFALKDVVEASTRHLPARFLAANQEHCLSDRELQILSLIRQGHESSQIAAILDISAHTVAYHRKSIRRKHRSLSFIEICALYFK